MIYFIQDIEKGPIKIGFSTNPESRLTAIQTGYPYLLQIIKSFEGTREDEMLFHRRLRKHRLMGEWFKPHKDVYYLMETEGKGVLDDKIEAILRLREEGYSPDKIAKRVSLSRQRVQHLLNERT